MNMATWRGIIMLFLNISFFPPSEAKKIQLWGIMNPNNKERFSSILSVLLSEFPLYSTDFIILNSFFLLHEMKRKAHSQNTLWFCENSKRFMLKTTFTRSMLLAWSFFGQFWRAKSSGSMKITSEKPSQSPLRVTLFGLSFIHFSIYGQQ